jgi:hypothetical protein
MKAWNELEEDPYITLYWTGDERNPDTHWYMDHGVKIEQMRDGSIEINNAMVGGDFYKRVTDSQYKVFEEQGWLAGCYNVCIDTYKERLRKVDALIVLERGRGNHEICEELEGRRGMLRNKLLRYVELSEKNNSFVTQ